MSNLPNLPPIPAGTTITIVSNTDWLDQFYCQAPGFPITPLQFWCTMDGVTGALTSPSLSLGGTASVAGVIPGMMAIGYGIAPGSTVSTVVDSTTNTITLNNPTLTAGSNMPVLFYGPALDLTGLNFYSVVRPSQTSATALLNASTANGLMVNSGVNGQFGWNVPGARLPQWPGLTSIGLLNAVVDVQASDASGSIVNLCPNGPIPLSVVLPETR
jgi:hypothetical protein